MLSKVSITFCIDWPTVVSFAMLGKFLKFRDDRSCSLGTAHVQTISYHRRLLQ